MSADYVVRVECGNCGKAFWCHELSAVGYLAHALHEHWADRHPGTIHLPSTTLYAPVPIDG